MKRSMLEEAVEEVRREKIRGARWSLYTITRAVIEDYENGLLICQRIHEAAELIRGANKSMAPLANLSYILQEACSKGIDLKIVARNILYHQQRSLELIREAARNLPRAARIATFSYSSTIEAILHTLKGDLQEIIVLESRPGGEGAILAANLRDSGASVRLLPDTMMYEAAEQSDYILVGADAVTRDGCLVNKLGTRQLALIARYYERPVVGVFDSMKIHPDSTCKTHVIEERTYLAPGYGPTRYPLFDLTPEDLIKAAITERGIIEYTSREVSSLWSQMIGEVLGEK